MASRLLTQLASRIAAARDPVEAACLRAQRGIYLARQGKHVEAQAIVDAIRGEFGDRPNAEVTAWISLVEALIHFYSQPGPKALDRLRRAHALSRAMNHPVLVPLCAAWLAHIEFNANRMEPMLQYAVEALRLAQPDHHAALARVSLVIADAFHYAGRFDLAKPWYAAVRQHALAEGDDAMISAMLHNVAAFRANQVRLPMHSVRLHPDEARLRMLETGVDEELRHGHWHTVAGVVDSADEEPSCSCVEWPICRSACNSIRRDSWTSRARRTWSDERPASMRSELGANCRLGASCRLAQADVDDACRARRRPSRSR